MQAAQRLASSEGVIPADGVKNGKSLFNLSWDPTLFSNIEQMDCEQAEKDALAQLEKDLLCARDTLKTKEDQVQAWLARAEELRQSIKERVLKKRR
eukprot:478994-Pyramimonas_sp.AAC.1